ncbi:hypothetical protein MSAN_01169000 [Mycena sanguinolenta]|uniref:Golgi apparatus membrane protein tvp38 n=1 Tax=Mycena sanguinolenta TaxID=230812 RepID=A0A8H7D767_9AGAR|nr:hypothetical protein MSAN_01169000 [Mycena sanguinolenta]
MSSHGPRPPSYPAYASHHGSQSSLSVNTKASLLDDSPRTPSPTQSEFNYLNGIKEKKSTKQKIQFFAIAAVLITAVILFSVYHTQIITGLEPVTDWLHDTKLGPLVPIALLIILSFPPLFGHELVAMLAGVAWDFPEACLIVSIGTLLGEVANFFVFKHACSARGGFLVVLVIRWSAIPPHFATAVFSTVGIDFWIFLAAAVLSLPKSFVPVYVGYAMKPENAEKIVLVLTILITIASYKWIQRKMEVAKDEFIYLRRKARRAKAGSSGGPHFIGMPNV